MKKNIKYAMYQILTHKLRFLLSAATLSVALAVALFGSMQVCEMTQAELIMKEMLGCDTKDVYTLRMFSYNLSLGLGEETEYMLNASKKIKTDSDVMLAGGFFIFDNDDEMLTETGIGLTLYTDSDLLRMFHLLDSEGRQAVWEKRAADKVPALVGYDLKDRYPVGTVIENYCGEGFDVEVTGILSENAVWPSAIGIEGYYEDAETYLDRSFVLDFSEVTDKGNLYYVVEYMSNFYIKAVPDKSAEIPEMVKAAMEENHIRADDVASVYEFNRSMAINRMEDAGERLILPILMLAVAVILSVMTGYVSLSRNRHNYQIFIASGMLRTDIYGIVLLETLIRTVIATASALIYGWISYLSYFGDGGKKIYFHALIWIFLLMAGLIFIQMTVLCIMMQRKRILEDNGGVAND